MVYINSLVNKTGSEYDEEMTLEHRQKYTHVEGRMQLM